MDMQLLESSLSKIIKLILTTYCVTSYDVLFIFSFMCHRWGGPLTQNWLDQQLRLQKHILSRMIELGMTPGNSFIGD